MLAVWASQGLSGSQGWAVRLPMSTMEAVSIPPTCRSSSCPRLAVHPCFFPLEIPEPEHLDDVRLWSQVQGIPGALWG